MPLYSLRQLSGLGLCLIALCTARLHAQVLTGPASMSGVILVDSTERPIVGAEVILHQVGVTIRFDSTGRFSATSLPAGRHRMTVRAVGYQSITIDIDVPSSGLEGVDVLLRATSQILERVDVRARTVPRHLMDFESRRRTGIGRFVDSTVLQATGPGDWAYRLQQQVPNLKLREADGKRVFYSSRGSDLRGRSPCYVRIIIDGVLTYNSTGGEELFDATGWSGAPIVAAEYYTVSQLPTEFNRLGSRACGALVLWTRR
jgi:hypothetical protein